MQVSKYLATNEEVSAFLDELMDKYDYVRPLRGPMFSESGVYVFEVR